MRGKSTERIVKCPKDRGTLRALVLLSLIAGCSAHAQIYAGQTPEGTLLLSSDPDLRTPEIIVEQIQNQAQRSTRADLQGLTMAGGYTSVVLEASHKYQVPSDLVLALISVESNFNPRAKSPKGACGLMQLMPQTARRFGVRNIFDPRENILAGTQYLRWLLDYFDQDLELAVAAYNAGEGAVRQAGNRVPNLDETRRYVPRVLGKYRQLGDRS